MIQKIKDLLKVKNLIDENIEQFKKENVEVKSLKEEFKKLKTELKNTNKTTAEMKKDQEKFLETMEKTSERIEESRKAFDEEIRNFKVQKTLMEKKLFERSKNEVAKELERLRSDVSQYNELKREMTVTNATVMKLGDEMRKLLDITKNIKAKDFHLERYAKELGKRDSEKLALMKRIDTLERMIGRSRRNKY